MDFKELINYKKLSLLIAGNDSIRKNARPKLYDDIVLDFEADVKNALFKIECYLENRNQAKDAGISEQVFHERLAAKKPKDPKPTTIKISKEKYSKLVLNDYPEGTILVKSFGKGNYLRKDENGFYTKQQLPNGKFEFLQFENQTDALDYANLNLK